MTLRRQMIALIAGPTLVIYVLLLGAAAAIQHRQSKQEVERAATRLASSYALRLDGYLREAAGIAETAARVMELGVDVSDEAIDRLLEGNVGQLRWVYGSSLAFEPGTRRPAGELFAPYVHRNGDGLHRLNIDRSVYDWYADPKYTWFTQPKQLGHGVWSAPYFDEGAGNILMSTYSAPFSPRGTFGGVCTVDIDLPRLRETVGREIDDTLDFVILSGDGRFVYHPDAARIMSRTLFDELEEAGRGHLADTFRRLLSGQARAGWLDGWESAQPVGVFAAPVPSTGWLFVARVPTDRVLRDVRHRTLENAVTLLATVLLIAGCIYFVAGRIAKPITALEQGVLEVARGNLEARIDEAAATVEIRSLAHSFNRMTADLSANLKRLADEEAERRKLERDLDIARGIQQGLLPTSKPDLAGYEIAGWGQPADQTGGDYYDWQVLPDGRVLVSLADVTGHGIGPAIMAAACRAYTRATIAGGDQDLRRFLEQMNELLVLDMPEGRFVTFVGVLLDPARHRAQMISAGHGPLFRCITSRGELVESGSDGIPLGLYAPNKYPPATEFPLEPGDFVLLVTDGLFEWANAAGERFGLERLRSALLGLASRPAEETIQGLYKQAHQFAGGAPQEDDVTIVIVRRLEGSDAATEGEPSQGTGTAGMR